MKVNFLRRLLVLSLFAIFSINAQESYKINYKFEDDKTYRYGVSTMTDIIQEVMGHEMKVRTNSSMAVKISKEGTESSGNMRLITILDSGKVSTAMQMKDTTIYLKDFSGKRLLSVMSPAGKVVERKLLDSVNTGKEMIGFFERGAFPFTILPENRVKSGEPWTIHDIDSVEMMGGKIINDITTKYTITGKENISGYECLKIAFEGDVKHEGKAAIMGMQLFIEGTGKMQGTLYFDPKAGIMVRLENNLDDEMTMAATGQQNMIIPISQSTKVTVAILK